MCEWVYGRKVQANCHVAYARNYYSVSHLLVGSTVDHALPSGMSEPREIGRASCRERVC